MDENNNSAKEGGESLRGDLPIETPKVVNGIEDTKPATQQQLQEVKEEMNSFERASIRWMKVTAGIGIVTACFICLQWCEMKSGGVDTKHLAEAASGQLGAMQELARAASGEAGSMKLFAERMKNEADNTAIVAANAKESMTISQGAYVTIGRKDGVVAEFAQPANGGGNAGLVIYFQNTGHLQAKFNWGLMDDMLIIPPTPDFPPIQPPRRFTPMIRAINIKDGSRGESGGETIAGDSVIAADVAEFPPQRIVQLSSLNRLFLISGAFEYCDALGAYSCRQFQMFYQGSPYNRFSLALDVECPVSMRTPVPQANFRYVSPCQTTAEEAKQRQEEDRKFKEFQKKEARKTTAKRN